MLNMKSINRYKYFLFAVVWLATTFTLFAQAPVELLTYPAPTDSFIDIKIQSHQGLPRYGLGYFAPGKPADFNLNAFSELVKLKYLAGQYADMNRASLTKHAQYSQDKKVINSYDAQNHLRLLAQHLCAEPVLRTYFCDNDDPTACVFVDQYGQRRLNAKWGGFRPNEFKQMRSYTSFVKEHLDEMVAWSSTFFKNDEQLAYFVQRSTVSGRYDFQKKGFWIGAALGGGGSSFLDNTRLVLSGPDQQHLRQGQIFMPLAQDKAKELSQQQKAHFMYLVFKVKIKAKMLENTTDQFTSELVGPVIQVYLDAQLTDMLTEISMSELISKP